MNLKIIRFFLLVMIVILVMAGCKKNEEAKAHEVAVTEKHSRFSSSIHNAVKEEVGVTYNEKMARCREDAAAAFWLDGSGFLLWKLQ